MVRCDTVAQNHNGGIMVARWHNDIMPSNNMCVYCVTSAWTFQVGDRMELHLSGMPGAW